jgi:hypothetical protein
LHLERILADLQSVVQFILVMPPSLREMAGVDEVDTFCGKFLTQDFRARPVNEVSTAS